MTNYASVTAWVPFVTRHSSFVISDVEVSDIQGVVFDEAPARLDGITHENGKNLVGLYRIVDRDLQQCAGIGIHGGLPELFRVHLAETFIALHRQVFPPKRHD